MGQDADPLMGRFVCSGSCLGAIGGTAIGSGTVVEVRDPRSNLISLCSSDSCNLKATFSESSSLTLVAAKRRAARQFGHIQVSPSQFVISSQHCMDDPEHVTWYHSPQITANESLAAPTWCIVGHCGCSRHLSKARSVKCEGAEVYKSEKLAKSFTKSFNGIVLLLSVRTSGIFYSKSNTSNFLKITPVDLTE